ncbi:MAG TPA: DMT family transporter [Actinomycetes bacterium]|nr:DMT family transporter [Actinomycetes bacterium]
MSLGVPLGLGSGLCWGTADFFGGVQSRRLPALTVAVWSQLAGAVVLAVALAAQGVAPAPRAVALGLAAGLGGGTALLLFYRGLAEGAMSIVAPVSACGAVVPVAAAFLQGRAPSALALAGIAAAIAGVLLVSRTSHPGQHPGGRPALVLAMALASGLGFGLYYVLVDAGTEVPGATPLWVVAGGRGASLLLLLGVAAARRRPDRRGQDWRRARWPGRWLAPVALVGVADTTANLLFAYAAIHGNLGVVGVLGSLYPVATVLLARFVLCERLSGGQNAGVVLALVGVALLAAA